MDSRRRASIPACRCLPATPVILAHCIHCQWVVKPFSKKSSLQGKGDKYDRGRNPYADVALLHDLVTIEFVDEIGHQTPISRIDPERDIDWQNRCVVVRPTTSKTGGGRVVPLRKADAITVRTIPNRWVHRWRALRKAAGWSKETAHSWRQDVCRHTFATYHAARFRNFAALQLEMGHWDSSLLRTRYVYAGKANEATARHFFRA